VVIASAIEPGVSWFAKRGVPRFVSVLAVYAGVVGSLFGLMYAFLPRVLADAQGLLSSLPRYLERLDLSLLTIPGTGSAFSQELQSAFNTVINFRDAFTGSTEATFLLFASVFGGLLALLLVLVLSFYFAIQETGVEDFLRLITSARREEYVVGLWLRAQHKIGLWMQGQLIAGFVCGSLAYVGLLVLGVPYALLLAIVTAFGTLIPIFGSLLSSIPALALGFTTGGVGLAVMVGVLYFCINQFESHVVNPLVVNTVVGVPPLLVILSVVVGAQLAGFLGVLIAIPVAAVLRELLFDYDKGKRAAQQLVS
jgi:predicted PurR-regulated permease PerM